MKANLYTCNLIFLSFLVLGSCKSQSSLFVAEKTTTNSVIPYETVKDSVLCAPPYRGEKDCCYIYYELPYFKAEVAYKEMQPFFFFNRDSLKSQLKETMKLIKKDCTEFIPGGDMIFEVMYNDKNLIGLVLYHESINGQIYPFAYFNYQLSDKTQDYHYSSNSTYLDIFKKEKLSDLSLKINHVIEKNIREVIKNSPYDLWGNEITNEDIKKSLEELENTKQHFINGLADSWTLFKHKDYNNEEGVMFYEVEVPDIIAETNNYTASFFFTFNDLKPFLKESFKKQIGM